MFSQFFIDRPRFAVVLSIALALAGAISAFNLPIKQYPDITPPQVRVSANYRTQPPTGYASNPACFNAATAFSAAGVISISLLLPRFE